MKPPTSFLWHDYETFGANPMVDRPAQFAAQRTDADLEPLGDATVIFCAPADDVLPHPQACLITGITPQQALREGLCETEFAQRILDEMMPPGTCSVGYNSLRFDDVVTRSLFYRNLRDPYEREWRNGNSRFDLIDLARMCYALRPDGIEWPEHEPGRPSFRLEDLTAANGISHIGAHDALADVRATIGLARRLRSAQPRLFDWALDLREQRRVMQLIDPALAEPVVHSSSKIAAERGCTSLFLPLAVLPDRPKSIVAFDLSADPDPLIREPADVVRDLVFTSAEDLPEELDRLPLKLIHTNHVPMIAPLTTLKGVDTRRIGLDPQQCMAHRDRLLGALDSIRHKVIEVFQRPGDDSTAPVDPDLALYRGGFLSDGDRHLLRKVLAVPPAELASHLWSFQDERLPLMVFRYRARNFPDTLTAQEVAAWNRDRRQRLLQPTEPEFLSLEQFRVECAALREQHRQDSRALEILDQLDAWVVQIGLSEL